MERSEEGTGQRPGLRSVLPKFHIHPELPNATLLENRDGMAGVIS